MNRLFLISDTLGGIRGGNDKQADRVSARLDSLLEPVERYSYIGVYHTSERFPEQAVQEGDLTKHVLLVHRKKQ